MSVESWEVSASYLRPKGKRGERCYKKRLKRRGLLRALIRRLAAARGSLATLLWAATTRGGVGAPPCTVRSAMKPPPRYYRGTRLAGPCWRPLEQMLDPRINSYPLGAQRRLPLRCRLLPEGNAGAARLITRIIAPYQQYWQGATPPKRGRLQPQALLLSVPHPLLTTAPLKKSPPGVFNDREERPLIPPPMLPRDAESVAEQRATHSLPVPFQPNRAERYQGIPGVVSFKRAVTTPRETTAAQADGKDKKRPYQHRVPCGKPRVVCGKGKKQPYPHRVAQATLCKTPSSSLGSKYIVLNRRRWQAEKIAAARRGWSGNVKRSADRRRLVDGRVVIRPPSLVVCRHKTFATKAARNACKIPLFCYDKQNRIAGGALADIEREQQKFKRALIVQAVVGLSEEPQDGHHGSRAGDANSMLKGLFSIELSIFKDRTNDCTHRVY